MGVFGGPWLLTRSLTTPTIGLIGVPLEHTSLSSVYYSLLLAGLCLRKLWRRGAIDDRSGKCLPYMLHHAAGSISLALARTDGREKTPSCLW